MHVEASFRATADITITEMDASDAGQLIMYLEDMDKKLPSGLSRSAQILLDALKEASKGLAIRNVAVHDDGWIDSPFKEGLD